MVAHEIRGYSVFPVVLPKGNSKHYIYFKKHEMKDNENDDGGRSIFFCNLPINSTISVLKKFFQEVAIGSTVESFFASFLSDCAEDAWVNLSKLTSDLEIKGSQNASDEIRSRLPKNTGVVKFIDHSSFSLAMMSLKKLSSSSKPIEWPLPNAFGQKHYHDMLHKRIIDRDELSRSVVDSLEEFNATEKESQEQLQQQAQMVDEDGFTLVVNSQRKSNTGIKGKRNISEVITNKAKKKEKDDFYRFQLRERKKEEMNDLLRKFKDDQEKVRHMKERKKFRPY